ncbi:HK97 gp10 family phage protein [Brevibacterium permense]|uniref:HK97 gp10 family phage protein n=1 Tax=Brevibacterium permense TaxID=234834 RepID=UPI0021CED683|nr:HK97 gp10 family phage protein [Brevibacterium permense]MCU4295813.1 HK97 gp10 family phage protein [Brevibacterium permense]
MAREIKFEGLDSLVRTLAEAQETISDDLAPVHAQAAGIAASRARSLAPVRTGRLKSSISSHGSRAAGVITASAPHARPVHWGVISRGIPARPFLSQGAQQSESQWIGLYADHVDDVIRSVKGK